MDTRKTRVAAVQLDCAVGRSEENLAHAAHWVEAAVRQGAELVLLPELAPGGYALSEELWSTAEPFDGCTTAWLRSQARRWGIYLGTSFLEAEGEHFYNSFVLATPEGEIAGRVRKSKPALFESYLFSGANDPHVLPTALGRIGVAICYENVLFEHLSDLYRQGVDLLLQPLAAGLPTQIVPGDAARFYRMFTYDRTYFARTLGAPTVMANRCSVLPGSPQPAAKRIHGFLGLSIVVDADGSVKGELDGEEGVIVADVQVGGGRRAAQPPRPFRRRWAVPPPWYAELWPLREAWAARAYRRNQRRKACALAAARRAVAPPVPV